MKHTNFDPIINQLRNIETEELKQAVLAHGGRFRFEDKDNRPVITSPCSDFSDTAIDVDVCEVSVNDRGLLCIIGTEHEGDADEIEFAPSDFTFGQLGYIINAIPETEKVKDVSRNVVVEINTVKLTDLQRIRKDACNRIKVIMKKHNLDEIEAAEISESYSPVIERHPFDDNLTKTLDSISLEDDELTFEASDCCDNATYDEDSISSDALLSVTQWLMENEKALEDPGEKEDEEETAAQKRFSVTLFNRHDPLETHTEHISAPTREEAERIALSGGLVNLASGWGVLRSHAVPTMDEVEDFFLLRGEDRKGITDSLLLDSGQEVLSGKVRGYGVSVIVCGDVRVLWKGQVYKCASQFPEELTEAIRKGNLKSDGEEDFVSMNNWYETRLSKDGKHLQDDVVDIDISGMTEDEAKSLILDTVSNWLDGHDQE